LNQALVGAVLLDQGGSLANLVREPLAHYRRNRDVLVAELDRAFGEYGGAISWNCPQGGFFLTLTLPFEFAQREVLECAGSFQVIPMPMQFFALDGSRRNQVRVAFSNLAPEAIAIGIGRFARFVRAHESRSMFVGAAAAAAP